MKIKALFVVQKDEEVTHIDLSDAITDPLIPIMDSSGQNTDSIQLLEIDIPDTDEELDRYNKAFISVLEKKDHHNEELIIGTMTISNREGKKVINIRYGFEFICRSVEKIRLYETMNKSLQGIDYFRSNMNTFIVASDDITCFYNAKRSNKFMVVAHLH